MTNGNLGRSPIQVPFQCAEEPFQACWNLGYHDGFNDVDSGVGEQALSAIAISTGADLAGLEGALVACDLRAENAAGQLASARSFLLPHAGWQRIGWAAWVMVAFYLGLAALTFGADLPLSALTIGEALGRGTNLTSFQMAYLQTAAVWSLGLTLCLIGFCLKILIDVLDHGRVHHWWETLLVVVACILSGLSLFGVSRLRDAMGRQQIASQELHAAFTAAPVDKDRASRAVIAARSATAAMSGWTAYTLMWVTITLPVLSAVSVIVASRQIRIYKRHNRALQELPSLSGEVVELEEKRVRFRIAIDRERQRLKQLEMAQHDPEFKCQILAAYRHGVSTGEAARFAPFNGALYSRLKSKLDLRRAS